MDEPYEEPRTAIEHELASIWAEVLGVSPIGVHDNFFDLGGDSLPVTQVVSRFRDTFQVRLPLHSLFKTPHHRRFGKIDRDHAMGSPERTAQPGSAGDGDEEGEL